MPNLNYLGGMNQNLGSLNLNNLNSLGSLNNMSGLGMSGMGNGLGSNMMGSKLLINLDSLFGNQVNLNPLKSQNRTEVHKETATNSNIMNNASSILGNSNLGSLGSNMNLMGNYGGNNLGSGLGSNY